MHKGDVALARRMPAGLELERRPSLHGDALAAAGLVLAGLTSVMLWVGLVHTARWMVAAFF